MHRGAYLSEVLVSVVIRTLPYLSVFNISVKPLKLSSLDET